MPEAPDTDPAPNQPPQTPTDPVPRPLCTRRKNRTGEYGGCRQPMSKDGRNRAQTQLWKCLNRACSGYNRRVVAGLDGRSQAARREKGEPPPMSNAEMCRESYRRGNRGKGNRPDR